MNMQDKMRIEAVVDGMVAKGWPEAVVQVEAKCGATGWEVTSVTYKTKDSWDPEWTTYRRPVADPEAVIANCPTPKELKTKKLLEAVASAQELGEELGLPADFVNPLTAMAEQLRTNILEGPKDA